VTSKPIPSNLHQLCQVGWGSEALHIRLLVDIAAGTTPSERGIVAGHTCNTRLRVDSQETSSIHSNQARHDRRCFFRKLNLTPGQAANTFNTHNRTACSLSSDWVVAATAHTCVPPLMYRAKTSKTSSWLMGQSPHMTFRSSQDPHRLSVKDAWDSVEKDVLWSSHAPR